METYRFEQGEVAVARAWTPAEVRAQIEALLERFTHRLPADPGARIVLKPNLNNDLVALTGNSVDLRVLVALVEALQGRGYRDLTVADGSNVGMERRGIDSFKRLRIDRLAARHGLRLVDLNHDRGHQVVLSKGAHPRVAATVLEADFLLSVPKIKTHVEAGLSAAMKNWVGIAVGQDKRHMHYDLGRNIFAINEVVRPDLILVDGLVGMEGNGPGDGDPFRFERLVMSDNAFLNDAVVCRLVGLPLDAVPYLVHAREAGILPPSLLARIQEEVPIIRPIRPAPPRRRLARLAERREIMWIKRAARPITDRPQVAEAAYRMGIIQDVYGPLDDSIDSVRRSGTDCGDCTRCADVCPTGLEVAEIGVQIAPEACLSCTYCWWACPSGQLELVGELHHLKRQVGRYKAAIEQL